MDGKGGFRRTVLEVHQLDDMKGVLPTAAGPVLVRRAGAAFKQIEHCSYLIAGIEPTPVARRGRFRRRAVTVSVAEEPITDPQKVGCFRRAEQTEIFPLIGRTDLLQMDGEGGVQAGRHLASEVRLRHCLDQCREQHGCSFVLFCATCCVLPNRFASTSMGP